jgi:hypothetical protein
MGMKIYLIAVLVSGQIGEMSEAPDMKACTEMQQIIGMDCIVSKKCLNKFRQFKCIRTNSGDAYPRTFNEPDLCQKYKDCPDGETIQFGSKGSKAAG